jgi:hypothetical protein
VARLDQVLRHRLAHHAKPYKTNRLSHVRAFLSFMWWGPPPPLAVWLSRATADPP